MYSLVNIAALVRDLARHPSADVVAEELLRAFALDAAGLALLDELTVDAAALAVRRGDVLRADRERPRALHVLAATRSVAVDAGLSAYTSALDVLERATLGSLDDLRTFVRRDVLVDAWEGQEDLQVARYPRALDVVADGIVGAHAGDGVLGGPWRSAADDLDLEPASTPWTSVVEAAASLRPDAELPPAAAEWAVRMHDACWAVHLTGRERDAAVTQLHALRALVAAVGPLPPLRTVSTVVAATHASVVVDVLDAATYDAMTQPLFRSLS